MRRSRVAFGVLLLAGLVGLAGWSAPAQDAPRERGGVGFSRLRVGGAAELRKEPDPALEGPHYTPFDTVKFAAQDLVAIDTALNAVSASGSYTTRDIRYLSLYNFPRSKRAKMAEVLAFTLNSLSRSPVIQPVAALVVPGTDGTLLRVNLKHYHLTPKAWALLGAKGSGPKDRQLPDPYFHAAVEKFEEVETDKGKQKRAVVTLSPPPWLALEGAGEGERGSHLATLMKLAGSKYPILRGDWFNAFAWWAPRYYDFFELGVDGNRLEKDFEKLVFADEKLAEKARTEAKGVVTLSRVALANRSMIRSPTANHALGGFYWASRDAKKSVRGSNMMQNLLREDFDAKEIIASLANGFQVYAVADNQGKLLDLADASIAQDFQTPLQDKQVYNGRNCAGCHDQGMWAIRDNVRRLSQKEIGLLVPDPKDAERIQTLFFAYDLKTLTDRDAALFEAAVLRATGKRPIATVGQFTRATYDYLDRPIGLAELALEVGLPRAKLEPLLRKMVGVDFTLTGLLADPPEPIRRDQFEKDTFPQVMVQLLALGAWND